MQSVSRRSSVKIALLSIIHYCFRNQPGLMLDILRGFKVPETMLAKMKLYMEAMRTDKSRLQANPLPFDRMLPKVT